MHACTASTAQLWRRPKNKACHAGCATIPGVPTFSNIFTRTTLALAAAALTAAPASAGADTAAAADARSPLTVHLQAAGGDALDLPHAISEALERAPGLAEARAKRSEWVWRKRGAAGRFLPQLQLYAGHLLAARFYEMALGTTPTDQVVTLKSPLTELGGSLSVPLFDGLQNVWGYKAASHSLNAADKALSWQAFCLQQDVRFRFHQVLAAQLVEQASEQDIETLLGHQAQIKALRRQGAATDFDVLRVEVQLQNAKVVLLEAQDRQILARRKLAQVMGYTSDARLLQGSLPRPDADSIARVQAIDEQPRFVRLDLAALAQQEQAHARLQQAAQSFWIPKVDLVSTLATYNMWNMSLQPKPLFKKNYTVGVKVRWNFFDGGAQISEAGAQRAQRLQLRHQRHAAQLQQSFAITAGKRDYLLAHAQLLARELNVQRAQENLRLARSGLVNGSRNSTDVLDAEQDLFASRAGAIEALLRIEQAAIHLDLALGTTL